MSTHNFITLSSLLPQRILAFWQNHERTVVYIVIAAAFLLRVAIIFGRQTYEFPNQLAIGYEMGEIGAFIANGEGFRHEGVYSDWMAPFYPYVIGVVFWFTGIYSQTSAILLLLIQAAAAAVTIAPLYALGKSFAGRETALLAALIWCIHPAFIRTTTFSIWSSAFVALWMTCTLYYLQQLYQQPSRKSALLAGLYAGLLALTDPWVISFLPVLLLYMGWRKQMFRYLLAGAGVFLLLTLPWVARHYVVFERFVPIEGRFGVNLWLGNEPNVDIENASDAKWEKIDAVYSEETSYFLWTLSEADRNIWLRNAAWQFIRDDPARFSILTQQRIILFWTTSLNQMWPITYATYALAALGVWFAAKNKTAVGLFLLTLLTLPIPYYISVADKYKYRFSLEPILIILVAYGILAAANIAINYLFKRSRHQAVG